MKISIVFGTRPEFIKLAPIIIELNKKEGHEINVCMTGQHREMLESMLKVFEIVPDTDLDLMTPNQTLASLTSKAISGVDDYIKSFKPDLIIVQGDTTTVFATSVAAFYNKIPIAHVEAGLRTFERYSPFPEEGNRVLTTHLSTYHFAPTATSKNNLVNENIPESNIVVTGNTVIDTLNLALSKIKENKVVIDSTVEKILEKNKKIVLITGHRRENFGEGFRNICKAIREVAGKFKDVTFVYPVHLNPNVQEPVNEILQGIENVLLIHPLDYFSFIALMSGSYLILTDSGGIQEEAPSLGIPVLVFRESTERPEAIEAGTVKLVGTNAENIVKEVSLLLENKELYHNMAQKENPYGDGTSSKKISLFIENYIR
jgi:UDP-N-acetylglucosamine 2-epimerase (non-hydrolysing)